MKLSHSKTASRRAHHSAGVPRLVATPSGVRRRHFMDKTTGTYRGKQIISVGVNVQVAKKAIAKKSATKKLATETKKK